MSALVAEKPTSVMFTVVLLGVTALGGCVDKERPFADEAEAIRFLDPGICQALSYCTVQNGTMVIRGHHADKAAGDLPLHILVLRHPLTISDSSWTGFEEPIRIEQMICIDCATRLDGVTLIGPGPGSGVLESYEDGKGPAAIAFNGTRNPAPSYGGGLEIHDVSIKAFDTGVYTVRPQYVVVRTTTIICTRVGIHVAAPQPSDLPEMELSDVQVTNEADCRWHRLSRGIRAGVGNVSLVNVTWSGHGVGAMIGTDPDNLVKVVGCTMRDNELGLELRDGMGEFQSCTITENNVGIMTDTDLVVRATIFEGNREVALVTIGGGGDADARCNWWGSPRGPRMMVAEGIVSPGEGDAVRGDVQAVPFLTEPPRDDGPECLASP